MVPATDTEAAEIVTAAVIQTASLVGDEFTETLMGTARPLARELIGRLVKSDVGGLIVPVAIEQSGSDLLLGALLTLQDRAVLAWSTGRFRVKSYSAVTPYEHISNLTTSFRAETAREVAATRVSYDCGERWHVLVPKLGNTDPSDLVVAALTGALTVERD